MNIQKELQTTMNHLQEAVEYTIWTDSPVVMSFLLYEHIAVPLDVILHDCYYDVPFEAERSNDIAKTDHSIQLVNNSFYARNRDNVLAYIPLPRECDYQELAQDDYVSYHNVDVVYASINDMKRALSDLPVYFDVVIRRIDSFIEQNRDFLTQNVDSIDEYVIQNFLYKLTGDRKARLLYETVEDDMRSSLQNIATGMNDFLRLCRSVPVWLRDEKLLHSLAWSL